MTKTDKHSSATTAVQTSTADVPSPEQILVWKDAEEKLRALNAEYEAKLDEVANLITRVRHEINNPLTGVLGQAQLLLREDLSERAKKRAETIEALAIRIRDIVAQLRQVQRTSRT
jgi:nitrogen-specific signal transduction histidine kinase